MPPPRYPSSSSRRYHPKRPNDYDSWTAIFEKENAAQRREKQESSDRERESQRTIQSSIVTPNMGRFCFARVVPCRKPLRAGLWFAMPKADLPF